MSKTYFRVFILSIFFSFVGIGNSANAASCANSQAYFRGTPNNWGTQSMTCVEDHMWETSATFVNANDSFKIDFSGTWASGRNYGDNSPRDGIGDANGANIPIASPGVYKIRFNESSRVYSVIRSTGPCGSTNMYVRGTHNSWGLSTPMTCLGNNQWELASVTIGADNSQLKFDASGTWATNQNWGDTNKDGFADPNGTNIMLGMHGDYKIRFNDVSHFYEIIRLGSGGLCQKNVMYFRSASNPVPWDPQLMVCTGNNIWTIKAVFTGLGDSIGGPRFKFDASGAWAPGADYGDDAPRDGIADIGGDDIPVFVPGKYEVIFNDLTLTYKLTLGAEACAYATMYERGTNNGWGKTKMECVGNSVWETTFSILNAGSFKFDVAGDWKTNWGDNAPRDGKADPGGANIGLESSGTYNVKFNDTTKLYTATKVGGGGNGCVFSTMFWRGSANNWAASPMTCVTGNKWQIEVTFDAAGSFKFDASGVWDRGLNWGDNEPNGIGDLNGKDIPIHQAGVYKFEFFDDTKAYVVTKM